MAASPIVHLASAFPGEEVDWDTYSQISERMSNAPVIVTHIPGRCGSTFLAAVIRGAGVCGTGDEVFNEVTEEQWCRTGSTLSQVFEFCLRRALVGGICWIQIAPDRFESLSRVLDPRILRTWKHTVLLRRDILAQAISYVYAVNSGVWHSTQGTIESEIGLEMDQAVKEVLFRFAQLEEAERKIRLFIRRYGGPSYLVQHYEDLIASPREEVLSFLRFHSVRYDINELTFDRGETVQRLKKAGDLKLYEECCRRLPWIPRLISERKRMALSAS
jgi:LPS sulfotransferase NodH